MNHALLKRLNRVDTNLVSTKPSKQNLNNTLKFLLSYQGKSMTLRDKSLLAQWTKSQLIELGPTFIKMGQFVSTRSDIFLFATKCRKH